MQTLDKLSLKGTTLNGAKIIEHERAELVAQPLQRTEVKVDATKSGKSRYRTG